MHRIILFNQKIRFVPLFLINEVISKVCSKALIKQEQPEDLKSQKTLSNHQNKKVSTGGLERATFPLLVIINCYK